MNNPYVYVPSLVNPSGGMSLAPPHRHQPIAICNLGYIIYRCSGYILCKASGQIGPLLSLIPEFTGFAHLIRRKNVHIFQATPVFPYPCPSQIDHPIRYTRTQSWSRAPNCNGYGGGIISTRKEQLLSFIQYASWGASPESGT